MTPTIDQLFSAGANAQPYSIDQILAGIQSQYTAQPKAQPKSQTIDEVLAGLSGTPNYVQPYKTGAAQYIPKEVPTDINAFKAAPFDITEYQIKYANDLVARGYSPQQAIEEAGLGAKAGSLAGSYYGNMLAGPIGGFIGGSIGGTLGGFIDDLF
jgi:hypothetical protein